MKAEILNILRESKDYVSGQELCNSLGVSRTAVWKVINQLKDSGYIIEAIPNKGYILTQSPDLINKEEISSRLETAIMGRNIIYSEEVDSTNTTAKRLAEETAPHGTLVIAEQQNAGKGRRGRSWSSPKGSGIWMSLILRPDIRPVNASMLTLVAAMAVSKGIREVTGLQNMIKWPNDIVVNGKKVCGILTEMNAETDYINYIVVGIGINVNTESFPEELSDVASSLLQESGAKIIRAELAVTILKEFESYYERFLQNENMSVLMDEYNSQLINSGREVRISERGVEYTAVAGGINESGELLVRMQDGSIKAVLAGEVSVRGLYHYV